MYNSSAPYNPLTENRSKKLRNKITTEIKIFNGTIKSRFNIKLSYLYKTLSFFFPIYLFFFLFSFSHTHTTTLCKLILNCAANDNSGVFAISKRYISRAGDMKMVPAGDERPDFPFNPAVDLDRHPNRAGGLVLAEGYAVVRRHRYGDAVEKRGPHVDVLVALVHRRDDGVVGDLLVMIGGVGVQLVVVNADFGVGVAGVDGDLEGGGDDVRGGDVEREDGGVLEEETGFLRLEDGPNQEDDDEEDEVEDEEASADGADSLAPLGLVVAAFSRHGGNSRIDGGGGVWVMVGGGGVEIEWEEEVTFDYNYVRVFGAAVKKCVCDSPNCRGYIGGDPMNSEVIVQGDSDDEFAEPVMICEDREMNDEWNDIMSHSLCESENDSAIELQDNIYGEKKVNAASQFESITSDTLNQKVGVNATQVGGITVQDKYEPDNSIGNNFASNAAVGPLDANKDIGESLNSSASASSKVDSEGLLSQMHSPSKLLDFSFQSDGLDSSTTAVPSKSQPDTIEYKKKMKYGTMGGQGGLAKSDSLAKTHRSSSSIKKGKLKSNVVHDKGNSDVDKSNAAVHKSKKLPDLSLSSHAETVEEKLNELLDTEGGISKRKDASRGYLKLLFLTAASGTNGHGESIQSNRDLSMILDALLKTKSRTVLVDIINKNGLQMLHNIMKRYRKEFIKTPILRKLLKVLEYLAMREILSLEHITGGPPCPGVESFKDSILTLTEHADKQVHQIARNFRDRWIPRSLRKNCFVETDDGKMEFHQRSSYSKLSVSSGDQWSDRGGKPAELIECCDTQTVVASGGGETSTLDHSSASGCSYGANGARTRKRKSRWDNPVDEYMHPRIRTSLSGHGKPNVDEDVPPGFSSPSNHSMVPATASSTALNCQERDTCIKQPFDIVLADSQERFIARMPVSYGVPSSVVQQFGILEAEAAEVWTVAPGLPFHPFPPLPTCGNSKGDQPTSAAKCASFSEPVGKAEQDNGTCFAGHSGQKRTMTCSLDPPEMNISMPNERPDFEREGGSYNLGRKFFRQQKWNHSKLVPPWVRMRNGWGHAGNTRNGGPGVGFGNGANQFRNPYISEDFNWRGEF